MQFASCNVASAVLVSSNPTNLVLTGAYEISFLVYSAWLVLPVLATAVVLFPLLLWGVFNDKDKELIPRKLVAPDVDPRSALIDKRGAIFGSVLLAITLVALVTLSAIGLLEGVEGVWTVTAPAAIVMVCRDLWHDLHRNVWSSSGKSKDIVSTDSDGAGKPAVEETNDGIEMQGMDDLAGAKGMAENGQALGDGRKGLRRTNSGMRKASAGLAADSSSNGVVTGSTNTSQIALVKTTSKSPQAASNANHVSTPPAPRNRTLQSLVKSFSTRFPTFTHIFVRLPLPLLPFAFSMFILVEALGFVGWIRIFGGWWSAWVDVGGVAGAIWLMGTLSVLGCNVSWGSFISLAQS